MRVHSLRTPPPTLPVAMNNSIETDRRVVSNSVATFFATVKGDGVQSH